MKTSTTFLDWTKDRFEEIGRARAWAVLRTMDCRLLERAGIEPELLEKGPDAWPWRAGNDERWSGIDDPTAKAAVDGPGAPIPFEPTARRGGRESPRSSDPGPRHFAA